MFEFLPIAKQIQLLFEEIHHPDEQRSYTLQEVSNEIDVSLPTLSQLRNGNIQNPQLHTLREICRFFDVPLHYFETRTVEECYAILRRSHEDMSEDMNEISFRAMQLSEESQQDVLKVIRWVQAAEEKRRQEMDNSAPAHLPDTSDRE